MREDGNITQEEFELARSQIFRSNTLFLPYCAYNYFSLNQPLSVSLVRTIFIFDQANNSQHISDWNSSLAHLSSLHQSPFSEVPNLLMTKCFRFCTGAINIFSYCAQLVCLPTLVTLRAIYANESDSQFATVLLASERQRLSRA